MFSLETSSLLSTYEQQKLFLRNDNDIDHLLAFFKEWLQK